MSFIVNKGIFVIGYRKAGTTTVFDSLLKETGITPSIKEPQFFCQEEALVRENIEWYKSKMVRKDLLIDGSTLLVHFPKAIDLIKNYVEEPYFIVCIRDPIKRMYSAYLHMASKFGKTETRNFEDILNGLINSDNSLIEQESIELNKAISDSSIDSKYFGSDYHKKFFGAPFSNLVSDKLIFFRYYYESLYSKSIQPWLSLKNTHLVLFEYLIDKPELALKNLFDFLELKVNNENKLTLPPNQNISFKENRLTSSLRGSSLLRGFKSIIPGSIIHGLKRFSRPEDQKISEALYKTAYPLFDNEFRYWKEKIAETEKYWTL